MATAAVGALTAPNAARWQLREIARRTLLQPTSFQHAPRPAIGSHYRLFHATSASTSPATPRARPSPSTPRAPSTTTPAAPMHGAARSGSQRTFSLSSLGTRVRLPTLRKYATESPMDVAKQVALFKELITSGEDKDKVELIGRFEELTQFWADESTTPQATGANVHPLMRDDEAFKLYLRSVAYMASTATDPPALFAKLAAAPTKRAALLEATAPTTTTATGTPLPAAAFSAKSVLSPAAVVSALFSGSSGRGKGGEAKILSTGAFSSWSSGAGASGGGSPEAIRVIVEEAKSPLLLRAAKFLFVTLLYSFLLLSLLSLLLDSSGILRGGAAQTTPFAPVAPPGGDPMDPDARGTTFKDVHGVEEAKGELYEVVEFRKSLFLSPPCIVLTLSTVKDPTKFEKLGGKLPRGVLLTGPPGTGKTLLARAVAGEAGVNFFTASGSEFDEMYVGVGARRIRELFAAARKAAPSIIFIDELDAIGGKRSPKDQHYVKQTLNQLLVELDGFSPGEGVILIGATNFPESLDKALIRPGRFDRHIVVPLPDVRGRMQILSHHMRNIGYDKQQVDISMIARGTIGFSGADLQALVNQAAVKASSDNAPTVRASHFLWAQERIQMGAARKSAIITDEDKLATAYHEGGHALVAMYTPGAYPVRSVTVVPRGNALGYTLMVPEMDKTSHSLAEYRAKLDVAMGGRVAEELIYGKDNVTDGASSDIANATSLASAMVRRLGFSDKIGPVAHSGDGDSITSPETQATIESEIRTLIEQANARAKELLKSKHVELERLARALVEHETLDLNEIKKVVAGEVITKSINDAQ